MFVFSDEDLIGKLCKKAMQCGTLKSWFGSYFIAERGREMTRNALVTEEYQKLGMTVLSNCPKATVYVPGTAEHRFVEARESTIRGAGWGAFLRAGRAVRQGTIVCEYIGRPMPSLPKSVDLCPYAVELSKPTEKGTKYVDGIDTEGNVMSYAALINDAGFERANVELVEFESYPGRVFVAAMRDIRPQEELFVSYGGSYWGTAEVTKRNGSKLSQQSSRGKRPRMLELQRCRKCGHEFPPRIIQLHARTCGDPLQEVLLHELDSLPRNEFTMLDDQQNYWHRFRADLKWMSRRSLTFVSPDDSATFANTHMDAVKYFRVGIVEEDVDLLA